MWITPGSRHLGAFFDEYCQRGEDMPISISIGLDPAVYMCCGFELPPRRSASTSCRSPAPCAAAPSSLPTASPFRRSALPMPSTCSRATSCTTRPSTRMSNGHGYAMPEFPGYTGGAKVCPVIKITAVTTRVNPIMESCIGLRTSTCPWLVSPPRPPSTRWSRPLSRAACSTFTPLPAVAASSLPSCSSRSRAKMTRAVSATPPCSPSRRSPSSSTSSLSTRMSTSSI